jgi:IclR family transcriptional regulator, acetate operon repressor
VDRAAIGIDRGDSGSARPVDRSVPAPQGGRGVLEGAFELLDALSRMPSGAGLSGLSRDSGLPKATTHRLLEQLVGLGAVQRDGQRYYVGGALARLGRSWQPHPALRRASLSSSRTLARMTGSAVAVCVLEGTAIRIVTSAGGMGGPSPRMHTEHELTVRTAVGQVLLAAQPDRDPPAGFSRPEWKRVRDALSRHAAVALDNQDILPGVYRAAAAIPLPTPGQVASICTLFVNRTPPRDLSELVLRAARDTTRSLACQ